MNNESSSPFARAFNAFRKAADALDKRVAETLSSAFSSKKKNAAGKDSEDFFSQFKPKAIRIVEVPGAATGGNKPKVASPIRKNVPAKTSNAEPSAKELLFIAYKKAYAQRKALVGHVALTVEPVSLDSFDADTARREMAGLISYLYGGIDPNKLPLDYAIMHAEKFRDQPVWYDILRTFLKAVVAEKKEAFAAFEAENDAGEAALRKALAELEQNNK